MRVWLDDLRDPARYPVGEVVWVKTAPAAIALLETGQVSWISLDNDLGEDEPEGRTVADWIEEAAFHGRIPAMELNVHSANPVATRAMEMALANARRFWARRPGGPQ